METFSALLAICAWNSPVTGEFPTQNPVTRSVDVFLIYAWINGWVNNRESGDFRCHRVHYDVTVMTSLNFETTDNELIMLHIYSLSSVHQLSNTALSYYCFVNHSLWWLDLSFYSSESSACDLLEILILEIPWVMLGGCILVGALFLQSYLDHFMNKASIYASQAKLMAVPQARNSREFLSLKSYIFCEYGLGISCCGILFNSLFPGRCSCNFKLVIFKVVSRLDILSISCEITLRGKPRNITNGKSALVQVMAWLPSSKKPLRWVESMLIQFWSSYGITMY